MTPKPSKAAGEAETPAETPAAEGNGGGTGRERAALSDRKEKDVVKKVAEAFKGDEDRIVDAATKYGRKLQKKKDGLRSSEPPLGILSKEQGAKVREALGIPAPEPKAKTAETPAPEADPEP